MSAAQDDRVQRGLAAIIAGSDEAAALAARAEETLTNVLHALKSGLPKASADLVVSSALLRFEDERRRERDS